MPRIRLERGPVVCERGVIAKTAWTRSKGLLGRSSIGEDEGSLNGTFVNGERIEQRLLEEGDRIQIGPHLLLFVPAA